MKCHQAEKWIDAALDGLHEAPGEGPTGRQAVGLLFQGANGHGPGLPPGWQAQLHAHLAACPRCRAQWEVLHAAERALRAPRPVHAPEGMLQEFRGRLAQAEAPASRPGPSFFWKWLWPAGSLAAAAAVLVAALNLPPVTVSPERGAVSSRSGAPSSRVEVPGGPRGGGEAREARRAQNPPPSPPRQFYSHAEPDKTNRRTAPPESAAQEKSQVRNPTPKPAAPAPASGPSRVAGAAGAASSLGVDRDTAGDFTDGPGARPAHP